MTSKTPEQIQAEAALVVQAQMEAGQAERRRIAEERARVEAIKARVLGRDPTPTDLPPGFVFVPSSESEYGELYQESDPDGFVARRDREGAAEHAWGLVLPSLEAMVGLVEAREKSFRSWRQYVMGHVAELVDVCELFLREDPNP